MSEHLILASGSPRRLELLQRFGIHFVVAPADIDEQALPDETGVALIKRVAREKAQKVATQHPTGFVLGADTGVLLDGVFMGKPTDAMEAGTMLRSLSGRSHEVCSAVALVGPDGLLLEAFVATTVWFASLPEDWIRAYVDGGDPMDKAGAYAIQNEAGLFVSRIEGSYSNVVGLPLFETGQLLRQAGLWHPHKIDS